MVRFLHFLVLFSDIFCYSGDKIYLHQDISAHHILHVLTVPSEVPTTAPKRPMEEEDGPPRKRMHPSTRKFLMRSGYFDR